MNDTPAATRRPVIRAWLYAVAALMVLTLAVGGATRLTESGLSIVEWKPITGVLPPLSQQAWQDEFGKYQQIPQYQQLNRGMSLEQFKTIFWWEWSHRMLGRLIGLSYLLPFLFFLARGWIEPGMRVRLWSFFGAIVFIGVVGWWMVRSGLSHRISVSQYRLAFHLTFASAIFAAILWTARELSPRPAETAPPPRLRRSAAVLAVMVLFQIYLGALVAGLDAGLVFNTWPLIDGALIPSAERLWFESPAWRNLFDNALTVQFEHRMMAYVLWLAAVLHAADAVRARCRAAFGGALALAALITVQAGIGIVTLLHQTPFLLASLHQLTGIAVLTVAIVHAERLQSRRPASQTAVSPLSGASVPRGTA